MANSVDPDEMPHSAASHPGLHCFLRPVYPNTYGKYGTCCSAHEALPEKESTLQGKNLLPWWTPFQKGDYHFNRAVSLVSVAL